MADATIHGSFVGLTEAELQTLKTNTLNALNAVLTGHQAYSRPGFSFTRVTPNELRRNLKEIEYALSLVRGEFIDTTYPDMSDPLLP
jgi:hypothetical protein